MINVVVWDRPSCVVEYDPEYREQQSAYDTVVPEEEGAIEGIADDVDKCAVEGGGDMHVDGCQPEMDNGEDCVGKDDAYYGLCKPEESESKEDDGQPEIYVTFQFIFVKIIVQCLLVVFHAFFLQNNTESNR